MIHESDDFINSLDNQPRWTGLIIVDNTILYVFFLSKDFYYFFQSADIFKWDFNIYFNFLLRF